MPKKSMGLSHINHAFSGEQDEHQIHLTQEEEPIITTNTDKKFVVFKLVDTKKRGGTHIPNIDDVVNPETGKEERMRLLVGVPDIWVKDQKHLDADYIRQNAKSLHFPRGAKVLRIAETDTAMLTFARLTRHNVKGKNGWPGSKFGFYEYDAAKEAQAALNKELLELDMAILVKGLTNEQVKKYMSFLKLPMFDQISGEIKNPDLLKRELMLYAKRNPTDFEKLAKERTKEIEISSLVNDMILDEKIDIGSQPGRAFWAKGGGLIGVIPNGRKTNEYLTELAMTNTEDGRTFLKQLQENSK